MKQNFFALRFIFLLSIVLLTGCEGFEELFYESAGSSSGYTTATSSTPSKVQSAVNQQSSVNSSVISNQNNTAAVQTKTVTNQPQLDSTPVKPTQKTTISSTLPATSVSSPIAPPVVGE